jgi:ubiquinone biosynthesis protein COQ9
LLSSYESDGQSSNETGYRDEKGNNKSPEASIRERILDLALDYVCDLGWSVDSLTEAAKKEGLPGVAHGLFQRGGVEILFHFEKKCNDKMMTELLPQSALSPSTKECKISVSSFMKTALQTRLLMNEPYISRWAEGLALKALPKNMPEALENLAHLVDDMWYLAGDKSTDFSWYTRRASLAILYGSSELYMLQDDSPGFENTWAFVEKGLRELQMISKTRQSVKSTVQVASEAAGVLTETAKNMAGFNWRWKR